MDVYKHREYYLTVYYEKLFSDDSPQVALWDNKKQKVGNLRPIILLDWLFIPWSIGISNFLGQLILLMSSQWIIVIRCREEATKIMIMKNYDRYNTNFYGYFSLSEPPQGQFLYLSYYMHL